MRTSHPIKRIIEFSGMPGSGKTTAFVSLTQQAPAGIRIGRRPRFKSFSARPAYYLLMAAHPIVWLSLYRELRRCLSRRQARRRTRMYLKHLWRRRAQLRSSHVDLIVEDEAFATWFARDVDRCPGFRSWVERNAHRFYPDRAGGFAAEYLLVPVICDEDERIRRLRARRLRRGEAYAQAEEQRDGSHASRRPAVAYITRLLDEQDMVKLVGTTGEQERLLRDPFITPGGNSHRQSAQTA